MVDLATCSKAGVGDAEEDDDGTDTGGVVVIVVDGPLDPPPDAIGPEPFDEDDGGGPPEDPAIPRIIGPSRIFIPGDGGGGAVSTEIVFRIFSIPVDNGETTCDFFDPNGDPDITVTEIPAEVTGGLVDAATYAGIEGFSAKLTKLDNPTTSPGGVIIYNASLDVTIPTGGDALDFYVNNPLLLDKLIITVDYGIIYTANFVVGENEVDVSFEWSRFIGVYKPGGVVTTEDLGEPKPPVIDYGAAELDIGHNFPPSEPDWVWTVSPIAGGWDLGDYEIIDGGVTLELPPVLDGVYSPDDYITFDEHTGSVTARSTTTDLSDVDLPTRASLIIRISCLPVAGYEGGLLETGAIIPITLVAFEDPGTEDFYWQGLCTTTSPETEVCTTNPQGPAYPDFASCIAAANKNCGITGDGTGEGDTGEGASFGYSNIRNKKYDTSIKVPSRLLMERFSVPPKTFTPRSNSSGRSARNLVRSVPLGLAAQARKRQLIRYNNGVTYEPYTFCSTRTLTEPISVEDVAPIDFSVTAVGGRPTVLSNVMDETVRGILRINDKQQDVIDYFYNALTSKKILLSLKDSVRDLLNNMLNVNGAPLSNLLSAAIRDSIIKDEVINFAEEDILDFISLHPNKEKVTKSASKSVNKSNAIDILLNNSVSINPDNYLPKNKNRYINWKTLAEDLNKRVVFKTSEGVETDIYIPNNEKITTVTSDGVSRTLDMQDGDFFVASPVVGDPRLTVFSDIEHAKVLPFREGAKAAYLVNEEYSFTLDCTSVTSNLVEFNADTTGARQDSYFLALDKNTIEDLPGSLFTRKTSATYNYMTTGIDDFVKHKAFPFLLVYLRHDDMLFNHLESSNLAKLVFKDFTLDAFSNTPEDIFLVRQLPQHILLIPSDKTQKIVTNSRSKLVNFNTRQAKLAVSPFNEDTLRPLREPPYLLSELTSTESINFGVDVANNVIWDEAVKYVFNTSRVANIPKYKNNAEVLPRKELPTTKILKELNNIKTAYSLTSQDSISTYDLVSRVEPNVFRSMAFDQLSPVDFRSRLRLNLITDDKTINNKYFIPVKEISNINNKSPQLLPTLEGSVSITAKGVSADGTSTTEQASRPEERPTGGPPTY